MTDKKPEELNDEDLGEIEGGSTKGLLGDDLGVLRGATKKPGNKNPGKSGIISMEEGETI